MNCFAEPVIGAHSPTRWLAMTTGPLLKANNNRKTRGARAFLVAPSARRNYAACLCIALDAGALPRIALTERSIAALAGRFPPPRGLRRNIPERLRHG